MVTVSHQQSRLDTPCRVIIETKLSIQLAKTSSDIRSNFACSGKSFNIIDFAENQWISAARDAISQGESAAIIPHHMIRPEALFFDMDATVIEEESLVEIAKVAGKSREIEDMTTAAMGGGMDFKESLKARLALLRGVDRIQVLSVKPTFSRGMTQLAAWCHQNHIPMFLVSGGFVDLAGPIAAQLGFKDYRANRFAWNGDKLAGEVEGEIIDAAGKRNAVSAWCNIHGFSPERCLAIGDGANDLLMMDFCGLAAGFSPKKVLWEHLEIANHTLDHRFLIDAFAPIRSPMM